MKTLGRNIKEARLNAHMSQKELSQKLGTSISRISEWECDRTEPSLYSVVKIIKALDISFEDLIDGIELEN